MKDIPQENLEDLEKDLDRVCEAREEAFTRLHLIEQKKKSLLNIYAKHTCPLKVDDVIINNFYPSHNGRKFKILEIQGRDGDEFVGESKYSWRCIAKVLRKDGADTRFNPVYFTEYFYKKIGRNQ